MSVPRNSFLAFLPHASGLVVGLATSVVTARYLGPEGRGVLSVALLAGGAYYLLASAGLGTAVTYFVSKGRLTPGQALGFCLAASLVAGTAAQAVALALWPVLRENVLRSITLPLLVATVASIPPVVFTELWVRTLMARDRFSAASRFGVLTGGTTLVTALIVLAAFRGDATTLVWTNTAVSFTIAIVVLAYEWRASGLTVRLPQGFLGDAVRYGARSYAGGLLNYTVLRMDTFVLNAFAPVGQVGFYSTAVTLAEKLWLMESAVSSASLPQVVSREREDAARLVADTARHLTLLSLVLAAGLFALVPWVVGLLYGAAFAPTAGLVRILLPGVVLYSAGRQLLQFHQGQLGKPGTVSLVSAGAAVGGIGLYLVLIPRFGAVGAAAATSVTYLGVFLTALTLFVRASGVRIRDVMVPRTSDLRWYRDRATRILSALRQPPGPLGPE